MGERWHDETWAKALWWSGQTTRRRFLGLGATAAGALGATMLVPAPWREAFGQAKPYKLGVMQPLTGTTDPRHMREDLQSYDFELSPEDVRTIEAIAGP